MDGLSSKCGLGHSSGNDPRRMHYFFVETTKRHKVNKIVPRDMSQKVEQYLEKKNETSMMVVVQANRCWGIANIKTKGGLQSEPWPSRDFVLHPVWT